MKEARIFFNVLTCFLLTYSTVLAKEYFVDTKGNDSNPGTKRSSFRSIYKASEAALPGDIITFSGGEYRLNNQFIPFRSGTYDKWILYRAAAGESVVFDGSSIKNVLQKSDSVKFSTQTQGLFQIEKVNYLRFENITVRNSDGAGFIVRGPECKKIELIGCKSDQSHNSGIGLWYCDSVRVLIEPSPWFGAFEPVET